MPPAAPAQHIPDIACALQCAQAMPPVVQPSVHVSSPAKLGQAACIAVKIVATAGHNFRPHTVQYKS